MESQLFKRLESEDPDDAGVIALEAVPATTTPTTIEPASPALYSDKKDPDNIEGIDERASTAPRI